MFSSVHLSTCFLCVHLTDPGYIPYCHCTRRILYFYLYAYTTTSLRSLIFIYFVSFDLGLVFYGRHANTSMQHVHYFH